MKITSAEFALSAASLSQLPKDSFREVAVLGRSNVGKSSLINKLCNRKNLTRTSAHPGKTRQLNYYLINKKYYFVDLPGYGYAKVPEQVRSSWGNLIEQYLKSRKHLDVVLQLVDARHEATELDLMMVGWLEYYQVPFAVILTKSDKLPRSRVPSCLSAARASFNSFTNCRDIIAFSSLTGDGKPEILRCISRFLEGETDPS